MTKLLQTCCIALIVLGQLTNKPANEVLELDTLRIEGYIYEPQVLFILEQPSIDLITIEEEKRHDFLDNIDEPLFDLLD